MLLRVDPGHGLFGLVAVGVKVLDVSAGVVGVLGGVVGGVLVKVSVPRSGLRLPIVTLRPRPEEGAATGSNQRKAT